MTQDDLRRELRWHRAFVRWQKVSEIRFMRRFRQVLAVVGVGIATAVVVSQQPETVGGVIGFVIACVVVEWSHRSMLRRYDKVLG